MGAAIIQMQCKAVIGNISYQPCIADDVATLSESVENLLWALDAFSSEVKALGLEV